MKEYHKIQSIFLRDKRGNFRLGEWARPELEYLAGLDWEWTEKVDGTNIRIGIDESGEYRVGGRTDRADTPPTLLKAIEKLGLQDSLKQFDEPITLYGEGYGAKIQKGGGNYRKDQGFVLFDVRIGAWWLLRKDVEDIAAQLKLDVVPVVGQGSLYEAISHTIPGIPSTWGDFESEGLVCRPLVPLFARNGKRVIVKVKTRDFSRLQNQGIDLSGWIGKKSPTN